MVGTNQKGDIAAKGYREDDPNHLVRQRINNLLTTATTQSIITVCAGAGCGKTRAVHDFLRQQQRPFLWVQLYEDGNDIARLWESLVAATLRAGDSLAERFKAAGFPPNANMTERFLHFKNHVLANEPCSIVLDDFHIIKEPSVLAFIGKIIDNLTPNIKIFLICRNMPKINIEIYRLKGFVSEINEEELNFTEDELMHCLKQQGLSLGSQTIRNIYKDTGGWAFAANLVTRSLKKVPMYTGFVKTMLKQNFFKLMEVENWDHLPSDLKIFLLRLSLIDRLSVELVDILAGGDDRLLTGLKQQCAYIRFDVYGGAYLIHHFYLSFLQSKQGILTDGQKSDTYKSAALWCRQNDFMVDALNYYEKISDYDAIVSVLWELLGYNTSQEVSLHIAGIFERASEEVYDRVSFFPAMHLYTLLCLARWKEFFAMAEKHERKLLALPESDTYRNDTLSLVYFFWGFVRFMMSTMDNRYDFDVYYIKSAKHMAKSFSEPLRNHVASFGSWFSAVGTSNKDAPHDFLKAVIRTEKNAANRIGGVNGSGDLCQGELRFYQGNLREAEPHLIHALEQGRKYRQFETIHRSLFYIMRIAITQGERAKTEQVLKELKTLLEEENYSRRFITYDIALGWYYYIVRQSDKVPDWLKGEFALYGHAYFLNNFGNQIKARYHYLNRNYLPLLTYIREMKQRESILYGRVEMLAMEACIHYQMKNKVTAWASLNEAYEAAAPNSIIMPFIELGKDMRTLISAALHEKTDGKAPSVTIPRIWLESIKHKATSYAKNQSMLITKHTVFSSNEKSLTAREHDVLYDLYHGFSQTEIANKRSLSINTVKMYTKNLYDKLHVHKIADLVRIAAEQGLV
ncbi:MAG: LuxR C-terminal-related transcriptional regulator [Defluviitaleaceae bacterium]|nr:LuxR C-terminal-related transcriptional regulator [Defluviitaleaceae bacterium]